MKKRVLIYYMDFHSSIGGGEYLSLLLIAELQKTCDVTLALNWKSDVAKAAEMAGFAEDIRNMPMGIEKQKCIKKRSEPPWAEPRERLAGAYRATM